MGPDKLDIPNLAGGLALKVTGENTSFEHIEL